MFKYCVWYELNKHHTINEIIMKIAFFLHTDMYRGHITINSHLTKENSFYLYNNVYDTNRSNTFNLVGNIYQTKTDNFYALQIDYKAKNNINYPNNFISNREKGKFHISIAYKLDEPFTESQIKMAQAIIDKYKNDIAIINRNDILLAVYFCNDKFPSYWKKIK